MFGKPCFQTFSKLFDQKTELFDSKTQTLQSYFEIEVQLTAKHFRNSQKQKVWKIMSNAGP